MAVFGRTFLPVLRMFFAIGTSRSILSEGFRMMTWLDWSNALNKPTWTPNLFATPIQPNAEATAHCLLHFLFGSVTTREIPSEDASCRTLERRQCADSSLVLRCRTRLWSA